MAKGILKYNLPEEKEEHEVALNGWRYKAVINSLLEDIRHKIKYEEINVDGFQAYEQVRNFIIEELEFHNIKV